MLDPIQEEIIEEFALFDDWDDRYSHIIACGKNLQALPADALSDANLVAGCQSSVWVIADVTGERVVLGAWSDALIVRGMLALLLRVYDGRKVEELRTLEPYFIERIGLLQSLSMMRGNGLRSMVERIRSF